MNLVQDFLISVREYRNYPKLLKNRPRRVFAFGALLMLVFWCMTALIPYAAFRARTGGLEKIVQENVPEFTLENGKLDVPAGFRFNNGSVYADVNTESGHVLDPDDPRIRTQFALHDAVFLADSEKLIYGASAAGTPATSGSRILKFSDFGEIRFTKADLLAEVPELERMFFTAVISWYFIHLAAFFLGCLVIAFFGQIFAGITRTRISFGEIYQLSIYTRSVPILLKGILTLSGLMFAEFPAMSFLYSLFVLSRVYKHLDQAASAAERPAQFDFDELRRQIELRQEQTAEGPEAVQGPGSVQGPEAGQGPEAVQRPESVQEPETEGQPQAAEELRSDAAGTKKQPDLILPPPSSNADIRPSDGWSFGTREEQDQRTRDDEEHEMETHL